MENKTSGAATQQASAGHRLVKVVPTQGEKKIIEVPVNAKWSEMKSLLGKNGYNLNNMKAVEGNTKHTLEHDDAALPEGDFKLFLMPYKSKSGADDTRSSIKALFADPATKNKAKEHFGNYTQKKNDDLKELFKTWNPGNIEVADTPVTTPKVTKQPAKKAPAKKETTKPHVEVPKEVAKSVDQGGPSIEEKIDFLYNYLGIKYGENTSKKITEAVTPKRGKNILEDDEDDFKTLNSLRTNLRDVK